MGQSNTGQVDHELKIWPEYYDAVWSGAKPWELRKNDRDFKWGDTVRFKYFDPKTKEYNGSNFVRTIGFILHGPAFGLEDGFCIFTVQ